jgi:hypothetical protein
LLSAYKLLGLVGVSQSLRRTASSNFINLEQRRQELELRKLEADIKAQKIENKRKELELIEKRRQLKNNKYIYISNYSLSIS